MRQLRQELGLTQEVFAQRLGIKKSALSLIETGKSSLTDRNRNILINELNVNPEWIAEGRGEMFNSPPDLRARFEADPGSVPFQSVPLYSLDRTGGLAALLAEGASYEPVDHIHIPNMPLCDGAVYFAGDGMSPLLRAGDMIMYKKLRNLEDVFWGDMYLLSIDVEGGEYVTVRYVRRSGRPDYVTLAGCDPRYADKEIAVSKIRAMALVKASIHMNSVV